MKTVGIIKDRFLIGTINITTIRVTMNLMIVMIMSIPKITIRDQFTLEIVITTTIKVTMTMMTLIIES
jgi:hypothetical protein